ncbi:MAG: UvrD-helicase domain-containing protein [Clostridia bacterium]
MDLEKLNDKQREAVTITDGPLLVLAGAGSGKTRVLTYRIAYLIEHDDINPYNILALTFTNKAAREMKARTEALVGAVARSMWVFTFHSFCARILRIEAEYIGFTQNFSIYDEDDTMKLISRILKENKIDEKLLSKKDARFAISDAKNSSLNPIEKLAMHDICPDILPTIYKEYQRNLKAANALDFDDLMLMTIKLFTESERVLTKYRKKFQYVLVDEYQDTNVPQYQMLKLLCEEHKNICVVGDDDQSIYGWRGATIRNILEFERDYSGAQVVRLEQNYRSTKNILDAANNVIANNKERKPKKLWTDGERGEKITFYTAEDERTEADYICKKVVDGVREGRRYSDFAVLYRTNAQSRNIESSLVAYGIPYSLYGGLKFYERAEIKDALSYLRLIFNPKDDAAFTRIINVPRRAIGDASISELSVIAKKFDISLFEAAHMYEAISNRIRNKLQEFNMILDELIKNSVEMMPSMLTEKVLQRTHYIESIDKDTREAREQNLKELMGDMARNEINSESPRDALMLYLEHVALVSDADSVDEEGGSVMLMTMHSAKGLEFPIVFLPGFEDSIFPSMRAMREEGKLEEERRLCYVAITRAKEKLYMICTDSRFLYGSRDQNIPSFFLTEIPDELIEEVSYKKNRKIIEKDPYFQKHAESSSYGNKMRDTAPRRIPDSPQVKNFALHDKVNHAMFGLGTITEVLGSGDAMVVTIEFVTGKRNKFAAAYAPLMKVDDN